jgi:hypothetical protein
MTDAGIETAAVTVIRSGVDLDNKKRYTEALVCYREGIQLLLNLLKGLLAFFFVLFCAYSVFIFHVIIKNSIDIILIANETVVIQIVEDETF